jgi:hypothetical protein
MQERTFAFLLDLGLGQQIEVGEDVGSRSRVIGGAVRGVLARSAAGAHRSGSE